MHSVPRLCLYLCLRVCVCVSQVVQYSSVSYTAPQMPVAPSQPYATVRIALINSAPACVCGLCAPVCVCVCDLFFFLLFFKNRQIEELSAQFAHVSCQPTGEATPVYPPSQGFIYAAPPPPPQPPSYCQPSPQVQTPSFTLTTPTCTFSMLFYDAICVGKYQESIQMRSFYRCLCITTTSTLPQHSTPVDPSHQASTSTAKRCNQPVKLTHVCVVCV